MGGKRKIKEVRRQDIIFFLFKLPEEKEDENVPALSQDEDKISVKEEVGEEVIQFEEDLEEDEYYDEYFGNGSSRWSSNRITRSEKSKKGEISSKMYTRRKKKKRKRRVNKRMYKTQGKIQNVHMMKKESKRQYNVLFDLANRYGCDVSDIASKDDLVQLFIDKQESACHRNQSHENRRIRDQEERDIQKAIQNSLIVPQNQIQVSQDTSTSMSGIEKLLYDLQFREITPEDYEVLGMLDESVEAKTTSNTSMERNTKIRNILPNEVGEQCLICYDEFEGSNEVRELRCSHIYHIDCIDKYLQEYSRNCPTCRTDIEEEEGL